MKVKVCDCIMGGGKTLGAISMMNTHPENRYLFVTPYLSEIQRIKSSCPALNFEEPMDRGAFCTKMDSLHELLSKGSNIACTHALFAYYSDFTRSIIKEMGYILILDEVMNVIEVEPIKKDDIDMLFRDGLIAMAPDRMHVIWTNEQYRGHKDFQSLMKKAQLGNLYYYNEQLMFWSIPVSSFESFKDVYILTYLFQAQTQRYYYEMNGVEFEYVGVTQTSEGYEFSDKRELPDYARTLIQRVHIFDDEKLNRIGDIKTALSSSWYKKAKKQRGSPMLERVANNFYNVLRNKYQCPSPDAIWTTFKAYQQDFGKKGYMSSFVSCTARATNEYRDRHYLAYCVNLYYHPTLRGFFARNGVFVDEDTYALSEMVQWIWRSAIRCGEDIWIYIPSKRMRTLLQNWLQDLANAPATIPAA